MPNGTHPHGKLKQEMATHIASLRRYAIALTRNTDEAEDLVQECLSRAIAGADTFRPDADLRVWLFRILHNVHISGLRRRKLETAVKADADAAPPRCRGRSRPSTSTWKCGKSWRHCPNCPRTSAAP